MDDIETDLTKIARELASASQTRLCLTLAEIADLEEQLRALKAQRDGQLDSEGRLKSYRPKAGAVDYCCPNCWIKVSAQGDTSTLLRQVPSRTSTKHCLNPRYGSTRPPA